MEHARVLLKLSGEAFASQSGQGIDYQRLDSLALQINSAASQGVQVAIVVGGGNFLRGSALSCEQLTRTTADQMGMVATIMNALALQDALINHSQKVSIFSALTVAGIADTYQYRKARAKLESGHVVLLPGGTGNPFVTTDSAASLRAIELQADILLKATKVDGVYDRDPKCHSDATRYTNLTFAQAVTQELSIMDMAAFYQCRDYNMPVRVFDVFKPDALERVLLGAVEGTLIESSEN